MAIKALDEVRKAMAAAVGPAQAVAAALSRVEKGFDAVKAKAFGLRQELGALADAGPAVAQGLAGATSAADGLRTSLEKLKSCAAEAKESLAGLSEGQKKVEPPLVGVEGFRKVQQGFEELRAAIADLRKSAGEAFRETAGGLRDVGQAVGSLGGEEAVRTLSYLGGSLKSVGQLSKEIAGTALKGVAGAFQGMGELGFENTSELFKGLADAVEKVGKGGSETTTKMLDGLGEAVQKFGKGGSEAAQKTLTGLSETMANFGRGGVEAVSGTLEGLGEAVANFGRGGVGAVSETLDGLGESVRGLAEKGGQAASETLAGLGEALAGLGAEGVAVARESLEGLAGSFQTLAEDGAELLGQDLAGLAEGLGTFAQTGDFSGVQESVSGLVTTLKGLGEQGLEASLTALSDLGSAVQGLGSAGFTTVAENVSGFGATLRSLGESGFGDVKTRIAELGSTLRGLGETGLGDVRQKLADFATTMRGLGETGLGDARQKLADFGTTLRSLGEGGLADVKQKLSDFGSQMRAIGEGGFADARQKFRDFGESIRAVGAEGFDDLLQRISDFGSQMRTLAGEGLSDVRGRIMGFGEAIRNLKDMGLDDVQQMLSGFGSKLGALKDAGFDAVKEKLANFKELVASFGKGTFGAFKESVKGIADAFESFGELDLGKVQSTFGELKGALSRFGAEGLEAARTSVAAFKQSFDDLRQGGTFETLSESFGRLKGAMSDLGSEGSLKELKGGLSGLKEALGKIGAEGFEAVKVGFTSFQELAKGSFKALREKFDEFSVALAQAGSAVSGMMQLFPALSKGLDAAKGAFAALNAIMAANPILAVVTLIAALVAALYIFRDETVTIGGTTATVGEWVVAAWQVTWERLVGLWNDLVGVWNSVTEKVAELWGKVERPVTFVFDVVRETAAGVLSDVGGMFTFLAEQAGGVFGAVGKMIGELAAMTGKVFSIVVDVIRGAFNSLIAGAKTVGDVVMITIEAVTNRDFSGFFDKIAQAAEENSKRDFFGELTTKFGELTDSMAKKAKEFAETAGSVISDTLKGSFDDVKKFFADIAAKAEASHKAAQAQAPPPTSPPPKLKPPGSCEEQMFCPEDAGMCLDKLAETQDLVDGLKTDGPVVGKICDEGDLDACKSLLDDIEKGFRDLEKPVEEVKTAFKKLPEAPFENMDEAAQSFDDALRKLNEAIADQEELLAGLNEESDEYKKAKSDLDKVKDTAKFFDKFGGEVRDASKALGEFARAEGGSMKAEKAAAFTSALSQLETSLEQAKADLSGLDGEELEAAQDRVYMVEEAVDSLKERFAELQDAQKTDVVVEAWKGFTTEVKSLWEDTIQSVFDGTFEGFGDLFEGIKKSFKKMLAEIAKNALENVVKIIFKGVGEDGKEGGFGNLLKNLFSGKKGGGEAGAKVEADADKAVKEAAKKAGATLGDYLKGALTGYAIGTVIGTFLGKEDNYAEIGGQILGVVGGIVGAAFGAPQLGAAVGAAVGAVIGSLIKKGLPHATAIVDVVQGQAQVKDFITRNGGRLDQISQYADAVVGGINELAKMTEGTLIDLPDFKVEIKNNKWYRVIDESGFVHKFGEDYEAAVNYAVLQALKNASFEDLSEEVQAAIKNSKATTIEGLASDIDFAKEVRDVDLDSVTKELRDVIRKFNEMRTRASELGISLDKIDSAFSKAVADIRENILSDLKSFEEMGLTDVEREAIRITEAFDDMREKAQAFNDELMREQDARNQEIQALQDQLAEQERLKEQYDQMAGLELPDLPEFDDEFGIRGGRDRPDFAGMAEEAGEEIKRLMDEIARLMALNTDQQLIDIERIDEAERQARAALRERVRDSLRSYKFADMTPVQQQLRQLSATFEDLRRDARAAGVPMGEVNSAFAAARNAIRKQFLDRLQPFEDMAQGLSPLEVDLRNLQEQFEELRTDAGELGISMERVDAAYEAAVENLREQLRDDLRSYTDQGENPMVVQLRDLDEKFEELRRSAAALGVSVEEVDAAYEAAVETLRKQVRDELQSLADEGANSFVVGLRELADRFAELTESAAALGISVDEVNAAYQAALEAQQRDLREGIQGFLDYGAGLTDLQVRFRDLTQFFDEQIESARALDEAMGTTGVGGAPGENEQLVLDAQAAAFQQLVDEFNESLQDLRDAGMSPVEIALRDMRDRFSELRANAELLGLSVAELTRLEQEAIDRMKDDLQSSLDQYLLSDKERAEKSLEEEFLGYLQDALNIYSYEPGGEKPKEKKEPFPAASELEASFLSVVQVTAELKAAFESVTAALNAAKPGAVPTKPAPTEPPAPEPPPAPQPSASELVLSAVGQLQQILSGQGLADLSPEAGDEITSAAGDLNLLLQQLRLGITDDIPAVQEALGNFVTLLQENGLEVGDSLLALVDALSSSDAGTFLQDLADQLDLTGEGFGALIDALLSGGLSLPDLMKDLANGVFDSIQAIIGDISPELAEALKNIGAAWVEAHKDTGGGGGGGRSRGDANRAAEQFQRDREALEKQLEQFEDLTLTATERELKRINEQFDEMRKNARRLHIPLERVEKAYEIAIGEQRKALEKQLEPFEQLGLTPVEQEVDRIKKQFAEIAASAELLGVAPERVEAARQAALGQQRKTVEQQLAPFEQLGLTPVEQEVLRLNEQFEELARSAEAVGISAERVEAARQAAIEQQRKSVEEQLRPFEELGLTPVEQEIRRINEQFEELARSAEAVGISAERIEAARQAAIEQQRKTVEQQLQPFEQLGLTSVEQEILRLNEQFDELARSAEAVGISAERVEAARQAALEQQRKTVEQQLQPFEEIGLSSVEVELRRLDEQFEELRRSAEAVGISTERVDAAYEAALQQKRDALAEQLRPFEELGLSSGERELADLNKQFEEIRANAKLLGFDLERVDAAYQAAIEDFWERALEPIRDFQESLLLSEDSPLTPEERLQETRRRFDELAAAALAGDFDAIQELPKAAQDLLDEGQDFFASGQGFQDIFAMVQQVLDDVLTNAPTAEDLTEQVADGAAGIADGVDKLYAATDENLRQLTTVIDEDLKKVSDTFDGLLAATGRGVMEVAASIDRNVLRAVDETGGATEKLIREMEGGLYRPSWREDEDYLYDGGEATGIFGAPAPPFYPPILRAPEAGGSAPYSDRKREDSPVVEELRLSRQTGHADAAVLHADSQALYQKLQDQSAEIRELRALMRRVTSRTEFGRRA